MNIQMSKETINLTKAKGNKMQGNWGELVLERVLEKNQA
jgi:DNA recombination protein RmuC